MRPPRARIETGLAVFVFLQTLIVLVQSDRLEVLLFWTRETWLLLTFLWAKNLVFSLAAALFAVQVVRVTCALDERRVRLPVRRTFTPTDWMLAASAVALGAVLRWVGPDLIPPGLWVDAPLEARALLLAPDGIPWLGGVPLHGGAVHEIVSYVYLHFYDLVFHVFGRGDRGWLAISALPGIAAVPAAGWLAYEVFGTRCALLATCLVALARGPLILSRWGYTPAALVALALIGSAAFLAALRTRRPSLAALSGIAVGLAFHTHSAAVAVGAALALFSLPLFEVRETRRLVLAVWAAATATAALWGFGFLQNPGYFGGRLRDVHLGNRVRDVQVPAASGVAGAGARLAYNGWRYSGLLLWTFDPSPRHGLPGHAPVTPLVGAAALTGIAASLLRAEPRRGGERLLMLLAGGSLAAGVFSDPGGAPNTVRTCVLLVLSLIWAAWALDCWSALAREFLAVGPSFALAAALAVVGVCESVPFLSRWPDQVRSYFCFDESTGGRLRRALAEGDTVLQPGTLLYPWVFETLSASEDPTVPVHELPRRAAADLLARPPARPFWYLTTRSNLDALREGGWRCARGVGINGGSAELVLARVVPARRA